MRKNQQRLQEEVEFMKGELQRKENILTSQVTVEGQSNVSDESAELAWILNAVFVTLILLLAVLICCMCIVMSNRKRQREN